ncbi:hypothetical protein [Plastoroseomonas hellenica]|uniref:hypothetical protein n=1 Tax=Plastoroseomonas hellenica TaxID=2687306 RepID=UPI001BAB5FBB|nr:hypothetical protein [Plastoroseomonas hellenica]MBR0641229.1 hypothetical protein [Plastoroseomonas hellenica]
MGAQLTGAPRILSLEIDQFNWSASTQARFSDALLLLKAPKKSSCRTIAGYRSRAGGAS